MFFSFQEKLKKHLKKDYEIYKKLSEKKIICTGNL